MKILVLSNIGLGLYKFRKELFEELIKQKHEVYVSCPEDEYTKELEKIGCKIIGTYVDRRGTNLITDFKLLLRYIKQIKDLKPDSVLTFTIKPNIYGGIACILNKVPYIPNITGLGTAVEKNGILQKITLFMYRVALRKSKCVFFQNEENEMFFKSNNIANGKHKRIPGSGVNLDYYSLLEYPSDNVINFLFIARVMKEKGIDQFLDAAEYIRKKYPNTMFHVLGFCEQNYEEKLNKMQNEDIIIYHGMQSDVREFHKMSHCTIHPTYYPEGMSNVLLESLACGRPILTTNRSGCREIIDDGVTGYVVEQQNSQDLINKIEMFLSLDNNSKKQMGLAGRMKVKSEFNRNIVVNAYLDEIAEVSEGQ